MWPLPWYATLEQKEMTLARPSDKKGQSSLPLLKKKMEERQRVNQGQKDSGLHSMKPVPPLILSFLRIKKVPQFLTLYPKSRTTPVPPQPPCTLTAVWSSGKKQATPAHFESQRVSETATHEVKSYSNFHWLLRNISFSVKIPTFSLLGIFFF